MLLVNFPDETMYLKAAIVTVCQVTLGTAASIICGSDPKFVAGTFFGTAVALIATNINAQLLKKDRE